MEEGAHLIPVARPPGVEGGSAGARIADHRVAAALLAGFSVPPGPRMPAAGVEIGCAVIARTLHPIEEGLPHIRGLPIVEPLTYHRELEGVLGLYFNAFAPVWIEKLVVIEADEASD